MALVGDNPFRVLFLDFDGVLLHHIKGDDYPDGGVYRRDPLCIDRVRRIQEVTGCWIVLSTSWRIRDDGKGVMAWQNLHQLMQSFGLDPMKLAGATPDLAVRNGRFGMYTTVPRHQEIRHWLDHQAISAFRQPRVVDAFAIVDDDAWAGPTGTAGSAFAERHFVKTNLEDGLTQNAAGRLIAILMDQQEPWVPVRMKVDVRMDRTQ